MRAWLLPSLLCAWSLAACERDPERGGAGESCARRDDCELGLSCVAQVCADLGDAGAPRTPAGPGGDCRARSDCREGLVCTANLCAEASNGVEPAGNRYSGRGESCQAKNDCVPELACVGGVCRDVSVSLARTAKGCYRVECESQAECCAAFVPNPNCEAYRENCETDPIFCNTYRNLCQCNSECVDEMCVAAAPGCETDAECTSQQTPYCVDGRCHQCSDDSVCLGAGAQCVAGVCMAACERDENCPLLHACREGECVETGCSSDRECAFMSGDALAVCLDGECQVPCDSDSDCASEMNRFEVCEQGQCVFVGCEADAECRALLGLQNERGNARAVCR